MINKILVKNEAISGDGITDNLKERIIKSIKERYPYVYKKRVYQWAIPYVVDYLLLGQEDRIGNDSIYQEICSYLDEINGKVMYRYEYIFTIIKVVIFHLYIYGKVELTYDNIEFLASKSTVLLQFMQRVMDFQLKRKDYEGLRFDLLVIIMFKNKIVNIENLNDEIIKEFKEHLNLGNSEFISHKQQIFNLEKRLFLSGILKKNPSISRKKFNSDEHYNEVNNLELKHAILWYLKNTKASKTRSVKKFHPHLIHFVKFIEKNFNSLPIKYYNYFLGESYKEQLQRDLEQGNIASKNWAYNCVCRINNFINTLIDNEYKSHPVNRNIFLTNIFDEKKGRNASRRESIPEYIVNRIYKKLYILDELEQALIIIYIETGMRLNELALLSLEDIHENAKELIDDNLQIKNELEDGIGWVKIISPKIKERERIVLISKETFKAFETIKNIRYEKFGNISPLIHESYPELGRRNYLILNIHGQPFVSMSSKIKNLIKKLDIKDDDGDDYRITAHNFRHTFLTDMVRYGCPIHVAMDLMGHVNPSMTQYYNHFEKDNQDILYEEKIIEDNICITLNDADVSITIPGKDLNKLHYLNSKYRKRGGFCCVDEFQEECVNIDCIDCPSRNFKTNLTFKHELKKSMITYYDLWISEKYDSSEKAVYFLYLSELYAKILEKVELNPSSDEISLADEEVKQIKRQVGL